MTSPSHHRQLRYIRTCSIRIVAVLTCYHLDNEFVSACRLHKEGGALKHGSTPIHAHYCQGPAITAHPSAHKRRVSISSGTRIAQELRLFRGSVPFARSYQIQTSRPEA
jgi:hypothetical protein